MPKETRKISKLQLRAEFAPDSFNETDRTIDVVFATETPVLRNGWDGQFYEILSMADGEVRLDRLNSGAPVLNTHQRWDLSSQIGVVISAKIKGKEGRATLKFSDRDEVKTIIQDVKGGIFRNISVGYHVYKMEKTEEEGKITEMRATDWEPFEISLVPMPADHNSGVRSGYEVSTRSGEENDSNEVEIINKKSQTRSTMTEAEKTALAEKEERNKQIRARNAEILRKRELKKGQGVIDLAKQEERTRSIEILKVVRTAKLPEEYGQELIADPKMTLEGARAAIINKMAEIEKPIKGQTRVTGKDEKEKKREAMSFGLQHRADPHSVKTEDLDRTGAREFRNFTLIDIAKECISDIGGDHRSLSAHEIFETAMGLRAGSMGISDFPNILANTVNRSLRMAYDLAPRTFMDFCRQGVAKDFRPMKRTQLGDVSSFDQIAENQEYKMGSMGEAAETYSVVKYGKIIPLSWEMLINDDLDAFSRVPMSVAQQAAQKQSDIVWGIITGNPNMADGNALFSTQHANFTGTGTALTVTSLGVARTAMRKQKSIGKSFLNLRPEFLIVAPDQEVLANQYTSSGFVANQPGNINPAFNTSLKVITEPRLSSPTWFMAASPKLIDTIEYSFLQGQGELFTEQRLGYEVDGLQIKARMVFGAKAIDWRGLYMNAGA